MLKTIEHRYDLKKTPQCMILKKAREWGLNTSNDRKGPVGGEKGWLQGLGCNQCRNKTALVQTEQSRMGWISW